MAAGEALGELGDRDEMAHSCAGKDGHMSTLWAFHGGSVSVAVSNMKYLPPMSEMSYLRNRYPITVI